MDRRSLGTGLIAAALCGCAAAPPRLPPIGRGEPVALKVVRADADGASAVRNGSLGNNIGTGAGSGAAAGVLWSFACGPFFFICMPVTAGIGALSGTAVGAAVGSTAALTDEQVASLRDRVAGARQARDPLDALRQEIVDRGRDRWTFDADAPRYTVTIELQDPQLTSTRDRQVGVSVRAVAAVQAAGQAQPPPLRKEYEYIGPVGDLSSWLDPRSDLLDTALAGASRQLAAQIVAELARD